MSTSSHLPAVGPERILTYAQALNEALREEMTRDQRVLVLGEDIGEYGGIFTVTRGLIGEFGDDRVIDTPISEGAIVGAALGLALTGYRPVVEIMFVDFVFVASDQLFNHVGKARTSPEASARCHLSCELNREPPEEKRRSIPSPWKHFFATFPAGR